MAEMLQAGRRVVLCLAVLGALVDNVSAQDSSPTGPTWPNMVSNCNAFHTVNGETCWDLTQLYGITLAQFYEWNPDVKDDCGTNYWLGYSYCVGVGPVISTTTTSKTTTTVSTTTTTTSTTSTTTTSRANNTEPYSISVPIITWNVTATETISNFPPSKTLPGQPADCFDWYEVGPVDTCESVVDRSSWMDLEDLHAWNPAIGDDCTGLYDGYWICVNVRPASVTIGLGWTTTDAPASVPTLPDNYTYTPPSRTSVDYSFTASPTQTGIVTGCISYYQAVAGDTCRNIVDGWYLTEKDFFAWNPALQGNCDGLWANYYYCVVGPSGITVGPSYATAKPTVSIPSGQTGECTRWYQRIGETCDTLVNIFGTFSRADFLSWNPSVKQDCSGLVDEQWYCVGVAGTPTTRTTPATTSDFPVQVTQSGIPADCSDFWLVSTADTCDSIASSNGISLSQFLAWNPAVGSSTCDNLVVDVYVCVGTGSGTTTGAGSTSGPTSTRTTTSGPTSTSEGPISTPTPTQAGMISGCRRFYLAQANDGCWAIANSAGISLDDFYAWNPPLNGDCSGLWLGYYYCIGLAGTVTTISSGPPVPTK